MKAYIIEKGHFSEAGNFIAFSTVGERIHIYKKQINRLFPNRQVKFPFYCLAENKTFNSTYGTTFNRLTAEEISLEKYEIVFYSTLRDRSLEEIIDFKANNLQQEHDELKAAHDKLQKEKAELQSTIEYYERQHEYYRTELEDARRGLETYRELYNHLAEDHIALVAKVDHYGGNAGLKDENERLKDENDRLRDEVNASQWDYEHSQLERDRLALMIINARETLMSCDLGLSQEKINQLINNA